MQRSISIPVFFPSIAPRPGRAVRLKLPRIAWAAALIAVGLGPASVIAEGEPPTTTITLHSASGILGIGAGEKAHSKAGHDLLALHREYQAYLQQADAQARGPSGFRSRNFMAPTFAGYVVIDTAAAGDSEVLAADLEALGLEGGAVFGHMVSGRFPMSAIPALETLDSLKFARPAYSMTLAGAVTSQGDAVIRADIARNMFGVDGTGVTASCPIASTAGSGRRRGWRAVICRPRSRCSKKVPAMYPDLDQRMKGGRSPRSSMTSLPEPRSHSTPHRGKPPLAKPSWIFPGLRLCSSTMSAYSPIRCSRTA